METLISLSSVSSWAILARVISHWYPQLKHNLSMRECPEMNKSSFPTFYLLMQHACILCFSIKGCQIQIYTTCVWRITKWLGLYHLFVSDVWIYPSIMRQPLQYLWIIIQWSNVYCHIYLDIVCESTNAAHLNILSLMHKPHILNNFWWLLSQWYNIVDDIML